MFRFDQLIRSDMTVRDVKQRYPSTVPLFEQFGFRMVCDDCDIGTAARRNGLDLTEVLEALNDAAFGPHVEKDESPNN
jgi:iron-sulfur cluster repair protein YtfE (RIC family)